MTTNKPACSFCPAWGHTWATPEGGRICFNCLRGQRNEYHDQCRRQAEEIAALLERPAEDVAAYQVSLAASVRKCGDLQEANRALRALLLLDLKTLHETTGRLLARLPASNDHEEN